METLTWLFFFLSCAVSGYLTFRISRWHYMRRIKKLTSLLEAKKNIQ